MNKSARKKSFPIVGIGASAGGLKAFTELLKAIPSDIDMAFVLIQHLDPTQKSLLPETLSRTTPLPFIEVTDGTKITKNHIYAMPSESYMTLTGNTLHLTPRKKRDGIHKPIDAFFQSLAKYHGKDAIGIVLSGTGNDGTEGFKAIKKSGGRTFAQDSSAQFKDMPQSAIDSGSVDFVLSPNEIARTLSQNSREITNSKSNSKLGKDPTIDAILAILHTKIGIDFRQYRQTSVNRRIQRRMFLNHIETVKEYHEFLKKNPSEKEALHKDILIHVTSFFRTPGQFEILKKTVFPTLFKNHSPKKPINIWIAGCATGEEAYSYAIAFQEFFGKRASRPAIRILGTDISKDAIAQASEGVYKEIITKHVSPIRISKFFTKVKDGYEVKKSIRAMCEFAVADVTQNPPRFDNDLVSCCNLLIYLGEALQQKALFMLSSALKPDGFLLLGKSEGLGESAELFSSIDSKQRIYSKKAVTSATDNLRKAINKQVGMSAARAYSQKVTIPQSDELNHNPRQEKIIKLKEAVELTQEYANEIISELDVMNEELQSTNEELTSSNEELQTANEELQTFQEELQTANEEMTTLNEELQTRNEEVTRVRDYAEAIIRTIREPLVVLNKDLRVISANRAFYKTFQIIPKETENQLVYMLGNKQWDIPHLRRLLEKILSKKTSITDYEVDHNFESIGHKTMLLNASTLKQGANKTPLILLAIEDITQRIRAEKTLKESEERFRFMADSIPQKIFTADTQGNIDYFNPIWMEFTGLTFEQIRDWGWEQFIHPDDLKENIRVWKHSIDTGEPFQFEHRFKRADGQYNWHLSRALPMRDTQGNIIKWFGSNTDIDEQKTALEHRNEFIGIASHELKTPVTSVKAYTQILQSRFRKAQDTKSVELVSKMDAQLDKLTSLIGDLLDITMIEGGRLQFHESYFDFNELVKETVEELQRTTERHRIVTELASSKTIYGDHNRLGQVLTNFMTNAIKYSPHTDKIIVKTVVDPENVTLCVQDFGIGMSRVDQAKVFERFYRTAGSSQTTYPGIGLGLYIAAEIIRRQNGKIWVETKLGKGSSFCFSLPAGRQGLPIKKQKIKQQTNTLVEDPPPHKLRKDKGK